MMNFNLSTKVNDKWKTFGTVKTNQFGKEQASFRLKDLEELVVLAKSQGKEWVNLSLFEAKPKVEPKLDNYKGQRDLNDSIPF